MADTKLSALAAVTVLAESDPILTVSTSASKRITLADLRKAVLAIQNLVAATTLVETDDLMVLDGTTPKSMLVPDLRKIMLDLVQLGATSAVAEADQMLAMLSGVPKQITIANVRKQITDIAPLNAVTTLNESALVLARTDSFPNKITLPNFRKAIGQFIELKDFEETATTPSSSAGVLTLDMELGNSFDVTLTENVTSLVLSNPPATGNVGSITLILRQDATGGRTFAWLAAIKWDGGTTPTISSAANAIDIYTLITIDAGTTWFGFTGGKAFA